MIWFQLKNKKMVLVAVVLLVIGMSLCGALDQHHHHHGNGSSPIFFVPTFKPAAPMAARLFSLEKGHFR